MIKKLRTRLRKNLFILTIYVRAKDLFGLIKGYLYDLQSHNKYNMIHPSAVGAIKYHTSMLVHFLEKGMCYPNPRRFGIRHVRYLVDNLIKLEKSSCDCFEYSLGINALHQWIKLSDLYEWEIDSLYSEVKEFIKNKHTFDGINVGTVSYIYDDGENKNEKNTLLNRHTIRDFRDEKLDDLSISYALDCFRKTPTACNRQMLRIYQVSNENARVFLHDVIPGIGGVSKSTVNYFVVTFDLSAIAGYSERNQGYFNAGLASMNFVNGLHLCGIGACFLQWNSDRKIDKAVLETLEIPRSERIAVIIGAGYPLNKYVSPISERKPMSELFKVID